MLGDHDKRIQVPLDEAGFVLGPNGLLEMLELQLVLARLFHGRVEPILEAGDIRHATFLTCDGLRVGSVTSGALSQPTVSLKRSIRSARRAAGDGRRATLSAVIAA